MSGLLFVAFLVPSFVLTSGSPGSAASAAKVQHYFVTHTRSYGAAALLTMLSILFGMFFYGHLRSRFRKSGETEWLSSTFFGGVIIFAMAGAIGAGVDALIADEPRALSASSLQLVGQLSMDLTYPALCVGLAVVYVAAGFAIRSTRVLPGWLAWVSFALGLVSISFFLGFIGLLAMPLWVLIVSVILASERTELDLTDAGAAVAGATRAAATAV